MDNNKLISQTDSIVKSIHESDIYGCFVEMGCGVAVSNALMRVPGATETIHVTESPYSRIYQYDAYNNDEYRAVSKESVSTVLSAFRLKIFEQSLKNKVTVPHVNTFYVASFQLGDINSNTVTHGWIAYEYNDNIKFYHISINKVQSRKDHLDTIALYALSIIRSMNVLVPFESDIDIVDGFDDNLIEMFDMIGLSHKESMVCIRDGKLHRMEDFFRNERNILIFKGSFNPIHQGHIDILEAMEREYGAKPKLMISSEIYGKGTLASSEIKSRVEDLNLLGYDVIVSKYGFFNMNIEYIRNRFNQPIVFGMGSDTLVRIFQSTYPVFSPSVIESYHNRYDSSILEDFDNDFKDVNIFVTQRDGYVIPYGIVDNDIISKHLNIQTIKNSHISSTQIRNENIMDQIPEKLRTKYKK